MSNNIYISFSADSSSNDAWVNEFLNSFRITLGKICSIPVNIYSGLDKNTRPEINISESNIIILVFNGYVSDDFAGDLRILEIKHQEFINSGKEIFVVVKSGKFNSIIPVYLRKFSQYNFFEINIRTNEVIDYTPFLKGEKENKFWSKLTDLAYDTRMFFDSLSIKKEDKSNNLKVYLAEVSKDQISNREILKREFLLSGYKVLPAKPLPISYKDYHDAAAEIIITADFSIHIMGEVYGDSPSGSDYSYTEIQNKIVTELLGSPDKLKKNFYRFVWLPPNLEPYDEKQIQYLKRLNRELNDNNSGEIIQCSIEEFKELIVQKVYQLTGNNILSRNEEEDSKIVIITDNSEKSVYHKIESQLKYANKSFDLIDLSQSGDLLPLALFRQKLKMAKGAILVNLSENNKWMQGMLGLTIKSLNNGRSNKKLIAAVSNTKSTIDFEALKVDFFSAEDGHLASNIEKFLNQVN